MAKVHLIVDYIKALEIGRKISVRSIASELKISEGTAYKAIKECESMGYIKTLPRAGTVRVESPKEKTIKNLTYEEILKIVDGELLGGASGIDKLVYKFIIGAMEIDAMKKYISPGGILIVGNREEAQDLALKNNTGVLITGGFDCTDKIKEMANFLEIPVISSAYDTFTIATLINKALSQNLIKQRILYVSDIMKTNPKILRANNTIKDWKILAESTGFDKFPILDEKDKLVGVVTSKDLFNKGEDSSLIEKYMKKPVQVNPKTTVAYASHLMEWDDLDFVPVTEGNKLVGVISKGDVLKGIKERWMRHRGNENIEDRLIENFDYYEENGKYYFNGKVTSDMLDPLGTMSKSLTSMIMVKTASIIIKNQDLYLEMDNIAINYIEPLQLDNKFKIEVEIINISKSNAKVLIKVVNNDGKCNAVGTLSALH